jgi:hypothetical protein
MSTKIEITKYQRSYESTATERAALDPARFVPINVDIPLSITIVKGAQPLLVTLREEIKKKIPSFDLAQFDLIPTYAEGLAYAHTELLAAAKPIEDLPKLAARAIEIRDLFQTDAGALVKRGLIEAASIADLKGTTGYLNVVSDVAVLARILRERWSTIEGKTGVKYRELLEAESLYERFMDAYGEREQQGVKVAAATEQRQRAFTLMMNAYDEARRAVSWLRWHEDDVDKFAPSPSGNRPRKAGAQVTDPATPPAPQPVVPATPPAPPVLNGNAAPGMPGSSPFTHG